MNSLREQRDLAQGWLDELLYRPSARLEAVWDDFGLRVKMWIEVFDSTRPDQTGVFPGTQIQLPARSARAPRATIPTITDDVIERRCGPDVMAGPLVLIGTSWPIPDYLWHSGDQRTAFRSWLRVQLHAWENHESDEWLREKATGKVLFDPHARERSGL